MRKSALLILIACLILLCACRSMEQQPTGNVGASHSTSGLTKDTAATTQPTEPTYPLPDTPAGELAKFNALFGDMESWYNRALTCEYTSPTQISLKCLFYIGFDGESREPTDAEWEQLKDQRGFRIEMDLMRLPVDSVNKVLTELFGITLEDMEDVAFEDVVYLESTNCYYHMVTDFLAVEHFNAIAVENMGNGTIRVYYTQDDWCEDEIYAVTLMPYGDGYRILSNALAE